MMEASHVTDVILSGAAPSLDLRLASPDDHRYIAQTWKESHKDAPMVDRLPWPIYKQTSGKTIDSLVAASRVIAAYHPSGKIIGWIAYAPGRSISTVHWIYTRYQHGDEKCRRRGVMTLLFEAAEVGRRVLYTHRGGRRHTHARRAGKGPSLDLVLVEWLRSRGVSATYVDVNEWMKP